MVLENTQFEFKYSQFHKTLPKSSLQMHLDLGKVFEIGDRKIFEHCHFVQNFFPVPEVISQVQSDPFTLGYGIFFKDYLADILNYLDFIN